MKYSPAIYNVIDESSDSDKILEDSNENCGGN